MIIAAALDASDILSIAAIGISLLVFVHTLYRTSLETRRKVAVRVNPTLLNLPDRDGLQTCIEAWVTNERPRAIQIHSVDLFDDEGRRLNAPMNPAASSEFPITLQDGEGARATFRLAEVDFIVNEIGKVVGPEFGPGPPAGAMVVDATGREWTLRDKRLAAAVTVFRAHSDDQGSQTDGT